jgi:dUTP pyrophosphatase
MSDTIPVPVQTLPHFDGLSLPAYATEGSAGCDVHAAVPEGEQLTLEPGARCVVPTGLCMAIPDGWEVQVRPRSGWALKQGISCLNSPGTIDADYRGEVGVILINHGQEAVRIERGMRIAQLVLKPVPQISWQVVDALPESSRGGGGFGSTGRS